MAVIMKLIYISVLVLGSLEESVFSEMKDQKV